MVNRPRRSKVVSRCAAEPTQRGPQNVLWFGDHSHLGILGIFRDFKDLGGLSEIPKTEPSKAHSLLCKLSLGAEEFWGFPKAQSLNP